MEIINSNYPQENTYALRVRDIDGTVTKDNLYQLFEGLILVSADEYSDIHHIHAVIHIPHPWTDDIPNYIRDKLYERYKPSKLGNSFYSCSKVKKDVFTTLCYAVKDNKYIHAPELDDYISIIFESSYEKSPGYEKELLRVYEQYQKSPVTNCELWENICRLRIKYKLRVNVNQINELCLCQVFEKNPKYISFYGAKFEKLLPDLFS